MAGDGDTDAAEETDESEQERWRRNFMEQLQELRVAQTGVQILFAFLLTLPFTAGFEDADTFTKTTYMVALLCAAAASAMLIAPVAYHRILFRQGRKPAVVRFTHFTALGGLGLLLVAMVSSVTLAVDLVVARPAALAVAAFTGVWFILLWFVAPWAQR